MNLDSSKESDAKDDSPIRTNLHDPSSITNSGSNVETSTSAESVRQTNAQSAESCRFLVSIHHPAQAHFYRYIIKELRNSGHLVRVCVRDKEMTAELLATFGIEHEVLAQAQDSLAGTALSQAKYESKLLREAWLFQPDVLTSIGGIEISHVAPIVGARSLAFMDTPSELAYRLTAPNIDITCVPVAYKGKARGEIRRYEGYHELAYLHPDRFTYEPDQLRRYGVNPDDRLFILRLVDWGAYHDVGQSGFEQRVQHELVSLLDRHGEVYITSEKPLPPSLAEYNPDIPPHLIHDLLSAADIYIGDSGTMATEAALLGTPAIRVSSVVEQGDMGNFIELHEKYGLLDIFANGEDALARVKRLLDEPTSPDTWEKKRKRLLADKIDVTTFAVQQLEQLGRRSRHDEASIYA